MKHSRILITILSFILLLSCSIGVYAQVSGRQYIRHARSGSNVEIQVNDGKYIITPMNEKIIHVTFLPQQKEVRNFSFAVDMQPVNFPFDVNETDTELTIETKGIDIIIQKNPFHLEYAYNDKKLLSENNGYVQADSSWLIDFNITPQEVLYGGGARVLGMNRRGNRLQMYNRAHYGYEKRSELMNYTIPMVLSDNGYAVLFDNAGLGYMDLDSKKNNTISYETYSGTPNYHVIVGDDWFDLVRQYTLLTGRQPLPPRWVLGNFSSRFGYHTQKETEKTVDLFFKEDIPLDAVIIDIYWFGKGIFGDMGNLAWLYDSFPSPDKMIKKFESKDVKTILVTEPFILTTSRRWDEAVKKDILAKNKDGKPYTYDFYFGNTGLIDIFKPEAREWFWDIYKDLVLQGIGGWWGDLGEPEVHPADIVHVNGTGNEVHNAYGHEWARVVYEGYRKDFPDVRPFILMRAGYAGSQRFGMMPWSGDVSRSWGGLWSQPEIALQMSMQGLAYMHSDLGGFAGGDSIDDELYVRWLQYGVFQPVFRPHAQEHIPAEPVFQAYRTKLHAKNAIDLRYMMMPYNYTLAFQNSRTGKPLMAPLFFYEPDNKDLLTYDSAYMWGDAFLVSPVRHPGAVYQEIYLPKGNNWIDFTTNQLYQGGKTISYALSMNNIPVFVKGGSFIPMLPEPLNASEYDINNLEMHFYVDNNVSKSEYSLYNDDGLTADAFEKGMYEMLNFSAYNNPETLNVELYKETSSPKYLKTTYNIKLCIHSLEYRPKSVSINGKKIKSKEISWNPVTNKLIVNVKCGTEITTIDISK